MTRKLVDLSGTLLRDREGIWENVVGGCDYRQGGRGCASICYQAFLQSGPENRNTPKWMCAGIRQQLDVEIL